MSMRRDAWSDDPSRQRLPPTVAGALASGAFIVPLALSASSTPTPNHPRILAWYLGLRKPAFKPPDWVIPVAWNAIEAGLALAAYRLVRAAPTEHRRRALALLSWNTFMIGGWGRLFFKHRSLGLSTVAAATMIATGAGFVREARPVDKMAARAGVPFLAWVSIATVLTASLWGLNRRRSRF